MKIACIINLKGSAPLAAYAPKCTAAKDYNALVDEYLRKGGGGNDKG